MAAQGPLSNLTCQLCEGSRASHFCNCRTPPTLFCMKCFPSHHAKYLRTAHRIYPVAALDHNPEEYLHKVEELERAAAELRRNLDRMEQFSHEFQDMIQTCVNCLTEYRSSLVQSLEREKTELSAAIEAAVQEATRCLDEGTQPESGLGKALWTLSVETLQVFSYSVTIPDMRTLCQTWASYQTTVESVCASTTPVHPEDLPNTPQEVANSPLPNLFAAVLGNKVELYDLQSQKSTQHTLSVNFKDGGSYIQVDTRTLLCVGGSPASTKVYGLDLPSLTLTALPPLCTPRGAAGVAKAAHTVFVFGGFPSQRSCEKYGLESRQWLPVGDMQEGRMSFTPCTFRHLIYLPCPYSLRSIETFSPDTETFTVLPISLPAAMNTGYGSVSFVANGELCVLTNNKQMGRWRIESEGEFRLFDTDRECWSSQLPLVVDWLVLIANSSNGKVEKFSLETYAYASEGSIFQTIRNFFG